jgi:hypothetical protein
MCEGMRVVARDVLGRACLTRHAVLLGEMPSQGATNQSFVSMENIHRTNDVYS